MRPRLVLAAVVASLFAPAIAVAAWPGGNGRIVFSRGGDLWTDAARVTATAQDEAQASWSPDGTRLAFRTRATSSEPYHVAIVDADGSDRIDLPGSAFNETQPGWSANGGQIVYRRSAVGEVAGGEIWVMRADGSAKQPLVTSPQDERYPVLSPDGTRLAFTRTDGADVDIVVATATGTGLQVVVGGPSRESAPAWSPDGARLAFERGPAENDDGNEIWTASACGGDERRLTANSSLDEGPAWSPDGTSIAFTRRGASLDIWRMAADGTSQTPVATEADDEESPDWQAAPRGTVPVTALCAGALLPPQIPAAGQQTVAAREGMDRDRDGLVLRTERALRTSDLDRDSDDDGLSDGREARRTRTSGRRFDTDRDGLSDGVELAVRRPIADPAGPVRGTAKRRFRADRDPRTRTNPLRRDSDRDGVGDGLEDRDRDGRRDAGERDPTRQGRAPIR